MLGLKPHLGGPIGFGQLQTHRLASTFLSAPQFSMRLSSEPIVGPRVASGLRNDSRLLCPLAPDAAKLHCEFCFTSQPLKQALCRFDVSSVGFKRDHVCQENAVSPGSLRLAGQKRKSFPLLLQKSLLFCASNSWKFNSPFQMLVLIWFRLEGHPELASVFSNLFFDRAPCESSHTHFNLVCIFWLASVFGFYVTGQRAWGF